MGERMGFVIKNLKKLSILTHYISVSVSQFQNTFTMGRSSPTLISVSHYLVTDCI